MEQQKFAGKQWQVSTGARNKEQLNKLLMLIPTSTLSANMPPGLIHHNLQESQYPVPSRAGKVLQKTSF